MCVHWYLSNHKVITIKGKFYFLEQKKRTKIGNFPQSFLLAQLCEVLVRPS